MLKHLHFGSWTAGLRPLAAAAFLGVVAASAQARAETISSALARAYINNPNLNAQRAAVRAADEEIPRATSSYRPSISATGSVGHTRFESKSHPGGNFKGADTDPRTVSLSVTQTIWNGNRIPNSITQAESKLLAARETMRNTEQTVLSDSAQYYMNVLRDTAIINLNKNNITVLEEQLRQTRDRFQVGEVTRTDVAQSEANLAAARSTFFTAQSNLQTSVANFRQAIGVEPKTLDPAKPLDSFLPKSLPQALELAQVEHPLIQALLHNVNSAQLQVKLVEGELYPTVGVTGSLSRAWDYSSSSGPGTQANTLSILGSVTVPIYGGGEVYARARQAKETLGQVRLQLDVQRDQIRSQVVSSWGQFQSSKETIQSNLAAVKAAEVALNGVREEAKVGQRTTLDVLNAQQTLLNARVSLVSTQRDRVVFSYNLLSAVGRLSAANLRLRVDQYDPKVHFDQVKDLWYGLRTPDGR